MTAQTSAKSSGLNKSGFDWPGLMRLGIGHLGLHPSVFWALTPIELSVMAGLDGNAAPCLRTRLDELARAFPDAGADFCEGDE